MKRKSIILSTMVLVFLYLAGISEAQPKFSLKLTGGYGTMEIGDINAVVEGHEDVFSFYASLIGSTMEGGLKKLNQGFEYEAEFIINLTDHFGLGIGAGFIQREESSEASWEFNEYDEYVFFGTSHVPEIKAIPIKLTAYYFLPIASRLNLFLSGGIGYYFGKIDYHIQEEVKWIFEEWILVDDKAEDIIEAKDNVLGFHGGIGFEYNVIKNLAIFIEGAGRYAKLKDWEGDEILTAYEETEINSGTLWYYERSYDTDSGQYYSILEIQKEKPTYIDFRNLRKAEVDFSGFSLRIGFRVKF